MAEVADLDEPRTIHLVGVGGAGISAIGIVLATMGHRVRGVDVTETGAWPSLAEAGVATAVVAPAELFASAAADVEVVAHSTAFPPTEADRAAAAAAGRTILDRAGILALICAQRTTVAVSGTHGKTSTTAMLATLLAGAGADPSYLVGATPVGLGRAARWGLGGTGAFVVEADESDGTFLQLGAEVAVTTNVDEDHLDHWGDIEAIEAAFTRFASSARTAIVCTDDTGSSADSGARARRVAAASGAVTVGEADDADLHLHDVEVDRLTTRFGLRIEGVEVGPVSVGTPGRHHARNAAVALAAARALGVPLADAVAALADYRGVARRFELVGEVRGATVVDDYAHNPGKVRALLQAARDAGWSRVVCIFQPHRYTRTRDLAGDFGAALALADVVAVTDVYGAGEEPIAGVDGRTVLDAVLDERPWVAAAWVPTLDDAAAWARAVLRPGDLCLTVGAGDVSTLGPRLVEAGP